MAPPEATLHVITGRTAVGKTDFAITWALEHHAEIVSCDSLLVYRGMDIGTARPGLREQALVPHHCLGLVEPDEPYSVPEYIRDAANAIRGIMARGRKVVITGGSGFYLKAFYRAVTDTIPVPTEVSARVRALAAEGLSALVSALQPYAPEKSAILDWKNPRRVAKALERCLASGLPLAKIHERFQNTPGAFDGFAKHTILLERSREEMEARIKARTRTMLNAGLVEEVRTLRDAGKLRPGTPAALSIGYRETLAWLAEGNGNSAALMEAIATATRQLAAKQGKWFRTQIRVDERIKP